jgi:hypothetical protein
MTDGRFAGARHLRYWGANGKARWARALARDLPLPWFGDDRLCPYLLCNPWQPEGGALAKPEGEEGSVSALHYNASV